MIAQPSAASAQVQRFANDITARLAQLAKDPPDLLGYLRVHADCIVKALRPTGLAYQMQNGSAFQRMLLSNIESLNYGELPEQENAFLRAVHLSAEKKSPLVIAPNTVPSAGLHGLAVEDAPAPEELPLFNRTPYEQMFVPIMLGQSAVGVLHIWFNPVDKPTSQARLALLKQICGEVELYLKARRLGDISQEVTRLSTYSRLLEELTGDLSLDSVSWNIVNYAREAIACDRVCLFIARDYKRIKVQPGQQEGLGYHFELFACSGLKRPHPRSEQAVILQRVAQKLTQLTLARPIKRTAEANGSAQNGNHPPNESSPVPSSAPISDPSGPNAKVGPDVTPAEAEEPEVRKNPVARPRMQLTLMARDPAKTATRPPEVNEYFDVMPMNWATVLPLFDRENRVCGIVLFEGAKTAEKLDNTFLQMRDLAISAGRALGTALYWNKQRSIRLAHSWVTLRQHYVDTPAKRTFIRVGIPFLAVLAALLFPVTYHIKGDARVLPQRQHTLPALVSTRLISVEVHEGEAVTPGQILARFDTSELEMQLRQVEQDHERALIESDTAMALGNETLMQVNRLSAAKSKILADKIRNDIARATIQAPFDGVVLGAQSLSLRVGQVMRIGEELLEVVDPRAWQVKVNMREQDVIFLGRRLADHGMIPATLKLAANPTHQYELSLVAPNQLAYGLDTSKGHYEFIAMLPLTATPSENELLKSGFAGRAAFDGGVRPVAYILFKDFVNFLRVRFF